MSNNNWVTVTSEIVYKAKRFTIVKDKVSLPDGRPGEYEYMDKKDFVLVIPKVKNSFWMVEQYRYPIKKRSLEFPAGTFVGNESPEECARRELEEEIGLKAATMKFVGRLDLAKGVSSQGFQIFLAENFKQGTKSLDDTEQDMIVRLVSEDELKKSIAEGKLSDSATISAYSLLNIKKNK